jgi:hypothetical protein
MSIEILQSSYLKQFIIFSHLDCAWNKMQHLMPSLKLLNFKHKLFCNNFLHLLMCNSALGLALHCQVCQMWFLFK